MSPLDPDPNCTECFGTGIADGWHPCYCCIKPEPSWKPLSLIIVGAVLVVLCRIAYGMYAA